MAKAEEGKRHNRIATLTVVASVAILVGTEVFGVAIATAWALGGLLEFSPTITYAIGTLLVGLGLYIMVPFVRRAWRLEAAGGFGDRAPSATSTGLPSGEDGDPSIR